MSFLIFLVLAISPAAPSAFAATATLKAADASGVSAFTNAAPGTNWTYVGTPDTFTNYFTGAFGMRGPADGNSYTFSGDSLTLQSPTTSGYSFIEKATANATYTINNFTNSGGIIRSGGGRTLKLTIAGNKFVIAANSSIWADQNGWIINSPLSGTGNLTNRTDGNANDTIAYGGNNSAWTGRMVVNSSAGTPVLILNNVNATPGNPASFTPDQIILGGTSGCLLVDNVGVSIANANGGVTLAAATTITNTTGITTTISEPITGAFALTKTGAGTLILSGTNTYSGATTLSGGTLVLSGTNLNTSAINISDSAGVTLTVNSAGATGSGAINPSNTGGSANARTVNFHINGGGTITLPNYLTGSSGVTTTFDVNNNGDSTVGGVIKLAGSLANSAVGTVTYNVTGGNGYSLAIDNLRCTAGADGTLLLNPTTANLSIGNFTGGAVHNYTLGLGGSSPTVNTVSGVISNGLATSVAVAKSDTGTWKLSGANTYTGNTTISSGILALDTSGSIASTNIVVSSPGTFDVSAAAFTLATGQTLTGDGVVTGNVATASSSVIIPGISTVAALSVSNNLNMNAGGTAYFDVSTTYNSGNDQVVVGGNLTMSSSDTIHINALGGSSPLDETGDYILFAVSGSTTMASTPNLVWDGTPPSNSGNYSVKKVGNNVVLQYSAGTPPTVSAFVTPDPSIRNQAVTITASVTQGSASIASVKVDLSAVGGSSTTTLVQDGSQLPSLVYTNTFTVSAGTPLGNPSLSVTVTDTSSPTPLTGTYNFSISVIASSLTWDGGGANDNWSAVTNWNGDLGLGLVGDSVTFAGTTRLTPSLDVNYSVTGVTFDGTAGSFTLGTTSSTLTNSGGIVNNSTSAETLNVPIVMSAAQTFNAALGNLVLNSNINNGGALLTVDGAANTSIGGAIFGGGGLTKTGNGTLTLTSTNSFSGNAWFKGGTTVVDTGGAVTTPTWCSVALSGGDTATLTIKGTGTFTNFNDFNVGDVDATVGTLNIQDNAKLSVARLFIGSGNNTGSTAQGTVNQTGGSVVETDSGVGTFAVGGRATNATAVGVYNISGGTLTAAAGIRVGGYGTGTFNVSGSAVINVAGGFNIARIGGSTGTLNLDGGTVTTLNITSSTGVNCTNNFNGAVVRPTTANTWVSGLTQCNVRNGGAILDTTNINVTISQALAHSDITGDNATDGGLTKLGSSKLTLTGTNTYTGLTTISNGTLEVNGGIASAAAVKSGATLGGIGTISGGVTNETGGIINPGISIGALTVSGNLTLKVGSTNTFEVNGSTLTNDVIVLGANVIYGGVLNIVTNGVFTAGQQFQLFSGTGATNTGNFTSLAGSPGSGLSFSFTNGVLSVVGNGPSGPAVITNSISGSSLNLSWPAGQGWRLQMQTNSLSAGLGTNWIYITDGSSSSTNITVDPAKPTAFYRLTYP